MVLCDTPGEVVASLAVRLERYVEGSLGAGLFAGPTNVELDRRLIVFNIQQLEDELRPLAIHLIAGWVWTRVRRDRRPRLLVIDEAWSLLRFAEGGAFVAAMARRAPIRASDFEQCQGTRYTVDTVDRLKRLYPQHRFIWLLGSDTLPNFHIWRDWRGLAREVPIAVIRRSGYDSAARAARAMGWLRRFVHPSSHARHWTDWSAPAIYFLRLPPDPTSATAIRAHDPPLASPTGFRSPGARFRFASSPQETS